jgi:hypothetical protein
MTLQQQRHDDDDDFDNGILRDGRTFRVPMRMADTAIRNRPGFVTNATNDERQRAYDAMCADLETRYRDRSPSGFGSGKLHGAQEGDICTCRGPEYPNEVGSPGHLKRIDDRLVCVPDMLNSPEKANDAERAWETMCNDMTTAWMKP